MADYEKPKEDAKWASISPDETYVLFSRHFNLFWMDMENYAKALEDEKDSTIVENQWTEDGVEYYSYGGGTRGESNVDKNVMTSFEFTRCACYIRPKAILAVTDACIGGEVKQLGGIPYHRPGYIID